MLRACTAHADSPARRLLFAAVRAADNLDVTDGDRLAEVDLDP